MQLMSKFILRTVWNYHTYIIAPRYTVIHPMYGTEILVRLQHVTQFYKYENVMMIKTKYYVERDLLKIENPKVATLRL